MSAREGRMHLRTYWRLETRLSGELTASELAERVRLTEPEGIAGNAAVF